jgi:hypothetical protein
VPLDMVRSEGGQYHFDFVGPSGWIRASASFSHSAAISR